MLRSPLTRELRWNWGSIKGNLMAKQAKMDGPIWALDWQCIIVGLVLLGAWVLSAHSLSLLLGLGLFIIGCALRSRWQREQLENDN